VSDHYGPSINPQLGRKPKRQISESRNLILVSCLGCAFVLRLVGANAFQAPLLLVWFGTWLFLANSTSDRWQRLENSVTSLVLVGVFLYLIFEFVPMRGPRIIEALGWLAVAGVTLRSLSSRSSNSGTDGTRGFVIFLSVAVTSWLVISSISDESKIRLLGLGYDNYGHLTGARFIATQGRSFLTARSDAITLVVTDTPQAAATSLAFVSRMILSSEELSPYLTLYIFAILAFPTCVICLWANTAWGTRSRLLTFVYVAVAVLALAFGHFGRVWLSGYFASNFATLYACIALRNVIASNWHRLRLAPIHTVVLFNIWPIMAAAYSAVLCLALLLSFLVAPRASSANLQSWLRKSWKPRSSDVLFLGSTVSIYFVLGAMSRTFVPGSYWTDGGIERPSMLAYIAGVVALALVATLSASRRSSSAILGLSACCAASFVVAVSYANRGELTYYPIKVLIGICCMALTAAAFGTSERPATRDNAAVLKSLLIGFLLIFFYFSQARWNHEDSMTFRGGYMGRLEDSIQSWVRGEQQVVDANGVALLSRHSLGGSRAVLYLSDRFESELNTRWINSLKLGWSDKNWDTWSQIRQYIVDGNYYDADAKIIETETTVVIRESYMGYDLQELGEILPKSFGQGRVCLLAPSNSVNC